jgi:branched-chain amino acid transport system permease protein
MEERARPPITTRRAIKLGLVGGGAVVYLAAVGLLVRLDARELIADLVGVGRALLLIVALGVGYASVHVRHRAGEPEPARPAAATALGLGALAGGIAGAVTAAFLLIASAITLQSVLQNVSDELLEFLAFGQATGVGAVILVVAGAALGAVGAAASLMRPDLRGAIFRGALAVGVFSLFSELIDVILYALYVPTTWLFAGDALSVVGAIVVFGLGAAARLLWLRKRDVPRRQFERLPETQQKVGKSVALVALVLLLFWLPQILGIFMSEIVGTVGLYILLGLGLNIVVGYAGLLDLGYVAFFAIGAYSTAILTSPASPGFTPEMSFWVALPIVIAISTFAGILIGAPVLRLRGDYLAIVTLGFGEIIRVLVASNWWSPVTGGAQGITRIPDPILFGVEFDDSQTIYYLILIACLIAAFISVRLQNSRVGRAWNAMREDESVAEAMGISIIRTKLLAFAIGAAIGSLAGIFFAVKIGSVFPPSFNILVSIQALALIILGGMGNVWGVLVGSLVLVGLPELLREFEEYRLLLYGAILVALMILKPEGLLPSARRRAELHEEEIVEDQFARRAGEDTAEPALAGRASERS